MQPEESWQCDHVRRVPKIALLFIEYTQKKNNDMKQLHGQEPFWQFTMRVQKSKVKRRTRFLLAAFHFNCGLLNKT